MSTQIPSPTHHNERSLSLSLVAMFRMFNPFSSMLYPCAISPYHLSLFLEVRIMHTMSFTWWLLSWPCTTTNNLTRHGTHKLIPACHSHVPACHNQMPYVHKIVWCAFTIYRMMSPCSWMSWLQMFLPLVPLCFDHVTKLTAMHHMA
jgi:hypothetical protein